jgi:hypothetical protein
MLVTPALPAHLLRELGRSPLSGAVVAVTLPVWYQLARSHDDVHTAATFMVISSATLLALAFDDRAERSLGACAVTRNSRRAMRGLIVASLVLAGSCAALLVADARGANVGSLDDRLPETVAAAALASAGAAVATRRGVRAPGMAAASTTVLAMATATGLAGWSVELNWLPQIANPHHASRWWFTAAIAGLAGCWWSRDPAAGSFVAVTRRSLR